jgi:hypothetical protein
MIKTMKKKKYNKLTYLILVLLALNLAFSGVLYYKISHLTLKFQKFDLPDVVSPDPLAVG